MPVLKSQVGFANAEFLTFGIDNACHDVRDIISFAFSKTHGYAKVKEANLHF
jgi:hypothetical protein